MLENCKFRKVCTEIGCFCMLCDCYEFEIKPTVEEVGEQLRNVINKINGDGTGDAGTDRKYSESVCNNDIANVAGIDTKV